MKIFYLTSIFLAIFLNTADAKAKTCNNYSGKDSFGILTRQCLNDILISYTARRPKGFFVITASEDDIVYIQATIKPGSGNLYLFEAVGPKYTKIKITPTINQKLLMLGWSLPSGGDGNFQQVISLDQILNNQVADMLLETLITYSYQYNGKKLTYFISNF